MEKKDVNDQIIYLLIQYRDTLARGASFKDTAKVEKELEKYQDRDINKSYFLTCNWFDSGIFIKYSNDDDELLSLANSLCTTKNLHDLSVTIFETKEYGGKAIYNHSNLGMIYKEKQSYIG